MTATTTAGACAGRLAATGAERRVRGDTGFRLALLDGFSCAPSRPGYDGGSQGRAAAAGPASSAASSTTAAAAATGGSLRASPASAPTGRRIDRDSDVPYPPFAVSAQAAVPGNPFEKATSHVTGKYAAYCLE